MHFKIALMLAMIATGCGVFAQQVTTLTPARGHYKILKTVSAKPKAGEEEIDRQRFPLDTAQARKRLSLRPYYLHDVSPSEFIIPDPPANSSEQTRAELNYLLRLQQQRTTLDVTNAQHMAGVYYNPRTKPGDEGYEIYRQNLFFIGRSIGTWFNPDDMPITADLMAHVWQDASYFIWSYKYKYLRVRPYVLDPDIDNLEDANWPAYPSGHAANSYINAFIYTELAPEFQDVFLKDAYDMAHSREIIGVHYPSDSEASRQLARQFVNKLFSNENFKRDFERARNEWKEKAHEKLTRPADVSPREKAPASSCQATASTRCQVE